MEYKVIPNLYGYNNSKGTYDDFFDTDKYKTHLDSVEADDFVKVDYVTDDNNTLGVLIYHTKNPEEKRHYQLSWQHPVAGRDILDDNYIAEVADKLLEKYK